MKKIMLGRWDVHPIDTATQRIILNIVGFYVQILVCRNRKDVLWIVEILLEDCNFLSHWLCRRMVYKQVQWWSFYLFSKIVFWKNPSMKIQMQLQIFIGPNVPKRLAIHVFHVPLCIRHWWSRYYWLHIELGLPSLHNLVGWALFAKFWKSWKASPFP